MISNESNENSKSNESSECGELFSLLLRLHPLEQGQVFPGSGHHVQAAFLDMVRQGDPRLAEQLHQPNQRRPYTLSLLQGFNHIPATELADAMNKNIPIEVQPGQVYWLRITMLDATVFQSLTRYLLLKASQVTVRLNNNTFEVSRLLASPDPEQAATSWVAYSSFTQLYRQQTPHRLYEFEFASPTAFSKGQQAWGKPLHIFPTPADTFESLARQWDGFAPPALRLTAHELTPADIAAWCQENVIVTQYALETRHLASHNFGQVGFLGHVTYEVKGDPRAPAARWLTPLAGFALFSGVGYKTAMGMGQCRCHPIGAFDHRQRAKARPQEVRL
jgi:CRISPR-associated endoribonuclease Cas6